MIRLNVNVDGVNHVFDTLALNVSDLAPVLKKIGGYLRKKAVARYKTQGFAPLADSTVAKREQRGLKALEKKLSGDVKRAADKSGKGASNGLIAALIAGQSKTVNNKRNVLAEFRARHRRRLSLRSQFSGQPLSVKQLAGLEQREKKAIEKSVKRPILGRLSSSLVIEVNGGTVTLASRVGGWSDVHNSGGTAGHGAKIPKRETIRLDNEDIPVIVEMLKEHQLLGVSRSE